MLPLVVRGMQNNLDSRLESISFLRRDNELYLAFSESGKTHSMSVGFYDYRGTVLDFRGEKYIVKCMGEALTTADGSVEYRIDVVFTELPNSRMLRITHPSPDRIQIEFFEIPNNRIVENIISKFSEMNSVASMSIDLLERRFGEGIIVKTIKKAFCPILVGADISSPDCEKIVEEENLRAASESRAVKLIRAVVDRFFKENPDTAEVEENKPEKTQQKKNHQIHLMILMMTSLNTNLSTTSKMFYQALQKALIQVLQVNSLLLLMTSGKPFKDIITQLQHLEHS